jgi:hypothetical protein
MATDLRTREQRVIYLEHRSPRRQYLVLVYSPMGFWEGRPSGRTCSTGSPGTLAHAPVHDYVTFRYVTFRKYQVSIITKRC